jgi:hypothetical protein
MQTMHLERCSNVFRYKHNLSKNYTKSLLVFEKDYHMAGAFSKNKDRNN